MKNSSFFGWSFVLSASVFILLVTGLIFYVGINEQTTRTVLRFTSLTSAIPFLLIFISKPGLEIQGMQELSQWTQDYRRYLWLVLTSSHLVHLYALSIFLQLTVKEVPGSVWLIGGIGYIIIAIFAVIELAKPSFFDELSKSTSDSFTRLIYEGGIWYIWLVFFFTYLETLSGYAPLAKGRQMFYTIPAAIVFLAAACLRLMVKLQSRKLESQSIE